MKCLSCGAEIGTSTVCPYCDTQISSDMRSDQEILNKEGCPKCHSTNIQFRREEQGEVNSKNGYRRVYKTVGLCNDCGYTWYPESEYKPSQGSSNVWLWILGWLFFFPAPVMVLIWRKKNTWDIKVKIGVTVAFWVLFFAIGLSDGGSSSSTNGSSTTSVEEIEDNAVVESEKMK